MGFIALLCRLAASIFRPLCFEHLVDLDFLFEDFQVILNKLYLVLPISFFKTFFHHHFSVLLLHLPQAAVCLHQRTPNPNSFLLKASGVFFKSVDVVFHLLPLAL